jgi:hypothetical protein
MRWLALVALGAGGFALTTLPRPTFPAPGGVFEIVRSNPLRVASSRYHSPGGERW